MADTTEPKPTNPPADNPMPDAPQPDQEPQAEMAGAAETEPTAPADAQPAPPQPAADGDNEETKECPNAEAAVAAPSDLPSDAAAEQKPASKPISAPKPAAVPGQIPVRQYLETTVVPILMQGMQQLVRERPEDPVGYMVDFLQRNNPKKRKESP